jgi:serine/threonine-protein kinase
VALTGHGISLGTLHYLAPEQVKVGESDARADIFALGAVIYESITGARAFDGDTPSDVIAAILERDPPSLALRNAAVPRALAHLVTTCLAKNPDERWQHAGDVARALQGLVAERSSPAGAVRRTGVPGPWVFGATALSALAAAGASALWAPARWDVAPLVRSIIPTPGRVIGGAFSRARELAIARDGSVLAYGHSDLSGPLRLKYMDRLEAQPLPGTEGGSDPAFSPDGRALASSISRRAPSEGSLYLEARRLGNGGAGDDRGAQLGNRRRHCLRIAGRAWPHARTGERRPGPGVYQAR